MEKVMTMNKKKTHKFPVYVVKRMGLAKWKYWLIRTIGVLVAFLVAGITCTIIKPGSFGTFYKELFRGCFDFSDITTIINLLVTFSIIMMVVLALIPAFKMKFWNIGAEGQILVGCLVSAGIAKFMPVGTPNAVILIMCAIGAMLAGVIWSVIPAIFKAFLNTNETLFTLMLNYIATISCALAISVWIKNGSQTFGMLSQGTFPKILGSSGTIVIAFAVITFVIMFLYVTKSKHGYEVSVVGESINTARYIGINVKRVIIRTMILSGVICGLLGFLLVCSVHRSFSDSLVGGKGFTGVLIAWLGHFDPIEAAFYAFLSAVFERGTTTVASAINVASAQFSAICTGMFFFIIIACEFFSRYKIKIHHHTKVEVENNDSCN